MHVSMLISDAAALSESDAGTDEERKDLGLALVLQVRISRSDV
jgi:hypothetical protein